RRIQERRYRRPGRRAAHKMRARGRWASMPTARRSRPRSIRHWSTFPITREFINDTSFQNLTHFTRYVPGVDVHQGEGNRDELIIRGVDSSANFYVNGFRDDVQYFRDLYNAQSVEVLKGPSAITFGRAMPVLRKCYTRALHEPDKRSRRSNVIINCKRAL